MANELISIIISIHAPRERSDSLQQSLPARALLFQSTLLVRGATNSLFIGHVSIAISIHAPRERSDRKIYRRNITAKSISIHAPRERSDLVYINNSIVKFLFQSTLLVRGATTLNSEGVEVLNISIHAPRERSDDMCADCWSREMEISIHAPRERSDIGINNSSIDKKISIHAPRERSDYPMKLQTFLNAIFQSTLLVRGATQGRCFITHNITISIHAPRERSDQPTVKAGFYIVDFNPRPS